VIILAEKSDTPRKRGRPKGSTSKTEASTTTSGVAYVYADGMVKWSDPKLSVKTIKMMMRNPYMHRPVTQIMNLLFPHADPVVIVKDNDDQEDEKTAKKLRQLYRSPDCNLKNLAKKCWLSWFYWGPFVYNIVYEKDKDPEGWLMIKAIRHLPAETFASYSTFSPTATPMEVVSQGELLPGIARYTDGNIYYSQTNYLGTTDLLKNVSHISPPNDLTGDPAGMPLCYVALSLIEMLNFAWACQRQKIARVGSPSIFLIVEEPQERVDAATGTKINDLEYAQEVLKNWGRNNQFPLLGNMKPVPIPTSENETAMDTINALAKLINDQWSPLGLIATDGASKIGGGDQAGLDLLRSFRSGFLDPVAELFVSIAEEWLDYNGYEGYSVYIHFPEFDPKNGDLDLRRAQEGRAAKDISRNEHRALLGLENKSDKDLDAMVEEWQIQPDVGSEFPAMGGQDNKSSALDDRAKNSRLEAKSNNPQQSKEATVKQPAKPKEVPA
jgi:hypothetical protein